MKQGSQIISLQSWQYEKESFDSQRSHKLEVGSLISSFSSQLSITSSGFIGILQSGQCSDMWELQTDLWQHGRIDGRSCSWWQTWHWRSSIFGVLFTEIGEWMKGLEVCRLGLG